MIHYSRVAKQHEKVAMEKLLLGCGSREETLSAARDLLSDGECDLMDGVYGGGAGHDDALLDVFVELARTRAALSDIVNGVYEAVTGAPGCPLDRQYVIDMVLALKARGGKW